MDDIDPAVLAAVMAAQEAEEDPGQEEPVEEVDEAVLAAVMAAAEAEQDQEEDQEEEAEAAMAAVPAEEAERPGQEDVGMDGVVEEVKMEAHVMEDIKVEPQEELTSAKEDNAEDDMEVETEIKDETAAEEPAIPGIEGETTKATKAEEIIQKMEEEKELDDFRELIQKNSLVGIVGLFLEPEGMYCKKCQKSLAQDLVVNHIVGEGHKLNTLWHHDKNLANVAGKLRAYPAKFEMEMKKHIAMLIKFENRALNKIDKGVRDKLFDMFPDVPEEPEPSQEEGAGSHTAQMSQEELAAIKAEFIASFYDPTEMMLVNSALSGDLTKFKNTEEAITALKVISDLGKVSSSYQRKMASSGYKVDKDCILDIKKQCGELLKACDNFKLKQPITAPAPFTS